MATTLLPNHLFTHLAVKIQLSVVIYMQGCGDDSEAMLGALNQVILNQAKG